MNEEIRKKAATKALTDEMLKKQGCSQQAREAIFRWYS